MSVADATRASGSAARAARTTSSGANASGRTTGAVAGAHPPRTDGSSFEVSPAKSAADTLYRLDARFGNDLSGFPSTLASLKKIPGSRLLEDDKGNQFALTPGRAPGHAAEQLRADRLYRILGVKVPDSRGYPDSRTPGNVVKLAKAINGGRDVRHALADRSLGPDLVRQGQSELVAHALLEHWNVFSEDDVRVRAPSGAPLESWVVRTPGALRYRVRGELKSTPFDGIPMALWTLRDRRNAGAAAVFAGASWDAILRQMDRALRSRTQLLEAVADDPDLHRVMTLRLDSLEYLRRATRTLRESGASDLDIDSQLKFAMEAERAGGKRKSFESLVKARPAAAKKKAQADAFSLLSPVQLKAVTAARDRARINHDRMLPSLVAQAQKQGLTKREVYQLLDYIRDQAEIQIYFDPNRSLSPHGFSFLSSPTYKNTFEISRTVPSSGDYRAGKESALSGGIYGFSPFVAEERPKYGTLNAEGLNVPGASSYGTSFLVLRPEVKLRSTFTPTNSTGSMGDMMGTADFFAQTLVSTHGMTNIVRHVLGKSIPPTGSHSYIEAQIHGPVEFEKDVARIVAPDSARRGGNASNLRAFSSRYNVPLFWNDGTRLVSD